MSVEKLHALQIPLFDELKRFELDIQNEFTDSSYNGIPLVSDESYNQKLWSLYQPYKDFITEIVTKQEQTKYQPTLGLSLVDLENFESKAIRLEYDLKEKYFESKEKFKGLEFHDLEYSKTKSQREIFRTAFNMLKWQIGFICDLINFYNQHVLVEPSLDTTAPTEFKPTVEKFRIRWLKSPNSFIQLIASLQAEGFITEIGQGGLEKLTTIFWFNKEPSTSNVVLSTKTDKIIWAKENATFGKLLSVCSHGDYGLMSVIDDGQLRGLTNELMQALHFSSIRESTKNPAESIRKAIDLQLQRGTTNSREDTNLTRLLKKISELE